MPLKVLYCDFKPERDAEIVRSIKTLESINNKPAAEFWKYADAQLLAFDTWQKQVAKLPPEKQVEVVAVKLKERNPGFDGKVTPKIIGGVVRQLEVNTDDVTDISPLRALSGLERLGCSGTHPGKGRLADLSPLKDMKLTTLSCDDTLVSDLSPLKEMKLENLSCGRTKVADLSPLKGMKLGFLHLGGTPVSDLSPLKGMPLTILYCDDTLVADLSPIKDMRLTILGCSGTKVSDLTPLKGMPLKDLRCDFKAERDAETLRSIKRLETINGKPAAAFWKEVDARKP
jgi:Leucine-rich repeat (LRR) protein